MKTVITKRAVAFIIDLFFLTFIIAILGEILNVTEFMFTYVYGIPILLVRDVIFGGRSLGKIIMGLKIVDVKTNKRASIWKLIVRNITSPIWFVDAIIIFSNNSIPRIMDRALGLQVREKNTRDGSLC